jgi:hypothetical protein
VLDRSLDLRGFISLDWNLAMEMFSRMIALLATPVRVIYQWLLWSLPGLASLRKSSLPSRWAMVAFFFVLLNIIAAKLGGNSAFTGGMFLVIALAGLLIIPMLVYYFVLKLITEPVSRFPEIDQIWEEGVEKARDVGIELEETPIFLVTGQATVAETRSFLKASGWDFPVMVPSAENSPLIFTACAEGIFLFLNGSSLLSKLAHKQPSNHLGPSGSPFQIAASKTMSAEYLMESTNQAGKSLAGDPDRPVNDSETPAGGTLLLSDLQAMNWDAPKTETPIFQGSVQLSSPEIAICKERLEYLTQLVWKSREPVCSANGIIAMIPFRLLTGNWTSIQKSIQDDLSVIRDQLKVRCPAIAIVSGIEKDEGFQEFMKRLPSDFLRDNRLGKGCDVWAEPTGERIEAVAQNAVEGIEGWIYRLFQMERALEKKHNPRLFLLLSRMRGRIGDNLVSILGQGFGYNPSTEPHLIRRQPLFSGCYFVASGESEDQQAFLRSTLQKVIDVEGEVEWAREAVEQDELFDKLANVAALIGLLSILSIIGMLLMKYWDSLKSFLET